MTDLIVSYREASRFHTALALNSRKGRVAAKFKAQAIWEASIAHALSGVSARG